MKLVRLLFERLMNGVQSTVLVIFNVLLYPFCIYSGFSLFAR